MEKVYFIDANPYDDNLYSGVFTDEVHKVKNKLLYTMGAVTNESTSQRCYGLRRAFKEDCFDTLEELKEELRNRQLKIINDYCEEIKTVEDLVIFATKHSLCSNDIEYDALEAYKKRASDLLNIKWE